MQIKIRTFSSSGSANVQVLTPDGEVVENLGVDQDQEVVLTALTATRPEDIEVGEVRSA